MFCNKYFLLLLRKYEDYIGLENLSKEFLRLNLPKASDILNAAAGPGILSAFVSREIFLFWEINVFHKFLLQLQTNGYGNIDAFDVHKSNIDSLMPTGLYRHYICRFLIKKEF